jgi:SAM-dependent methyltransferase
VIRSIPIAGSTLSPADYDALYDSPRGRWIGHTEYRLLSNELALPSEGRILDVGCGTGWFTRRLASLPGQLVTGIDLNVEWLAFARSHDPRSTYLQANALALPFADNSFDHVLSVAALCFTTDWHKAVSEIVRVTRRRFVIGMLNRNSLLWREKGRHGGSGAYQGALWLSPDEFAGSLKGLPISGPRMRSAIYLPSGTTTARIVERLLPGSVPWGGFMVLSGDKKPVGDCASRPASS